MVTGFLIRRAGRIPRCQAASAAVIARDGRPVLAQEWHADRSLAVIRACGPYLRRRVAVSVHHIRAQTGDCEDDPDHDHRVADVLADVFADDGHEAGKPGADPRGEKQCLALT